MNSGSDSTDPRRTLRALRSETIRRASNLGSSFEGIVEAASDVATDDEHDPEGHTIAWERQQIAGLLDETRAMLADIAAAERHIEDGTYGRCTMCGGAIAVERLEALPATPFCITCAL